MLKLTFASSVVLQDSVVQTMLFVCSVSRVDKIISYDTINLEDDNRYQCTLYNYCTPGELTRKSLFLFFTLNEYNCKVARVECVIIYRVLKNTEQDKPTV